MRIPASMLLAAALVLAAQGCNGYSDGAARRPAQMDGSDLPPIGGTTEPPSTLDPPPPPEMKPDPPRDPDPAPPEMEANPKPDLDAGVIPAMPSPVEQEPNAMDASQTETDAAVDDTNLRIATTSSSASHFTDALGRPLYMFIDDVPAAMESACLDDCAREWPPFDVEVARIAAGIDRAYVARFHRQDGAWQTTYKGYPLYLHAKEPDADAASGDGVDRRWFVARDYLTFLAITRTFAPAGGTVGRGDYLTDGFGRTLYVCLDDKPATALEPAISTCDADCIVTRPAFSGAAAGAIVPSILEASELDELTRLEGTIQLTYRGWPLYYFTGDTVPGSTEGHNDRNWRAIDPVLFGLAAVRPDNYAP